MYAGIVFFCFQLGAWLERRKTGGSKTGTTPNKPSVPCKTKTCLMCRSGICVAAQICTYHDAPHTAHVG